MCECLKKYREAINADDKFEDANLETSLMINFETGKTIEKAGKLTFSYRTKKKDGTLTKTTRKSYISFHFCPFCGKEYEPKNT